MTSVERPHQEILSEVRPELAPHIRAALPETDAAVIVAIRRSVPEYAQPLEGRFGNAVRTGVREALRRFVADIESPGAVSEGWRAVYENLGRGELRQGRTLEALLSAYRIGARVSWRRMAEAAAEAGATPAELTALAEAVFAYIDELSALSADGYAAEQAIAAGETQRRRDHLVRLLIEGAGSEVVSQAARDAEWPLPATASVLLSGETSAAQLAGRLGAGTVASTVEGGLACAIVPDATAPGRAAEIDRALGASAGALGPDTELGDLPLSLARARLTLSVGLATGPGAVQADEHLPELIVHRDPALLEELAGRALAPLSDETPLSRERMIATLRAWLDNPGRPTAVARAVHVHPQTARYRLDRLRELLDDIDDPGRRFELALALRAPSEESRAA